MHTYWLGIMAVCLAAALALWITLVFRADRQSGGEPQENLPHREIVGGTFEARRGGRQVMPDPTESAVHEPGQHAGEPGPPEPAQAPDAAVPRPRAQPTSQRPSASQERT